MLTWLLTTHGSILKHPMMKHFLSICWMGHSLWMKSYLILKTNHVLFFLHLPIKTQQKTTVLLFAPGTRGARFVLLAAKPLREPVAWGGPVVMNSGEELETAFDELDRGTFIKHKI